METTPILGLPLLAVQQAQAEVMHNEALVMLQALQLGALDRGVNTPPGSPVEGDVYILGGSPVGAWANQANKIAIRYGGSWRFVPGLTASGEPIAMGAAHEGLTIYVRDEDALVVWTGSAWTTVTTGGGGGGPSLTPLENRSRSRNNLVPNGDFSQGTTSWTLVGFTHSANVWNGPSIVGTAAVLSAVSANFPVAAGLSFAAGASIINRSPNPLTISIQWLDAGGVQIGATTPTSTVDSFGRVVATGLAPANTVNARIRIEATGAQTGYCDVSSVSCVWGQFDVPNPNPSPVLAALGGRATNLEGRVTPLEGRAASRNNLVRNGDFALGAGGWTLTGLTWNGNIWNGPNLFGTAANLVAQSPTFPVAAGQTFTAGATFFNRSPNPLSIQLEWLDAGGIVIGQTTPVSSGVGIGRAVTTGTAPANTVTGRLQIQASGAGTGYCDVSSVSCVHGAFDVPNPIPTATLAGFDVSALGIGGQNHITATTNLTTHNRSARFVNPIVPAAGWWSTDTPPGRNLYHEGRVFLGLASTGTDRQLDGDHWLSWQHWQVRDGQLISANQRGGAGIVGATRNGDRYSAAIYGADTTVWGIGQSITAGMIRGWRFGRYQALNSGTTAWPPPTHMTGTVADGGGVQWQVVSTRGAFMTPIGVSAIAESTVADGEGTWATYTEGTRRPGGGVIWGREVAMKNMGPNDVRVDPFQVIADGATIGDWFAGGGDANSGGSPAHPATVASVIGANGTTWNQGILFQHNAFTTIDGRQRAIGLAPNQAVQWWHAAGQTRFEVRSDFGVAGRDLRVVHNGFGLELRGLRTTGAEEPLFGFGSPEMSAPNTRANQIFFQVSTTTGSAGSGYVEIAAAGFDNNVDIRLSPKGGGLIMFGNGSAPATTPANFSADRIIYIRDSNGSVLAIPCRYTGW